MATIIRDVVIFGEGGEQVQGDCLIEDGRIAELGRVTGAADEQIDGGGLWLWPGAFDTHVHLREPGTPHKEDWETASRAAAAGGVTSAFDMPNTDPATTTAALWEDKAAQIPRRSIINLGLYLGATPHNTAEYEAVARRAVALKVFMASSTGDLLVDKPEDQERVFAAWPGLICVHAEDEPRILARTAMFRDREDVAVHSALRDPEAARLGVMQAARLAARFGRRLHVLHASTRAEQEALGAGRALPGAHRISAEACPHHLFLSTDDYAEFGTRIKINPPIREEADRLATWAGLLDETLQMVATDHAPHLLGEKAQGYWRSPSGAPGVQTMLPLLLDAASRGVCSYAQVLRWVCEAPADIFGIEGRGRLKVGAHADLVLIDPGMRRVVTDAEQYSKCGWSLWSGRALTGWPVRTLVGGRTVYVRDGAGAGQIVADQPCGALVVPREA
jgi:dihydroorotase